MQTFVLGLMLFLTMPVWATVGYIDTINGPPNAFSLTDSNGKNKLLAPGTPLQKGDRITISKRNQKHSITLILNGKTKTINFTSYKYYIVSGYNRKPDSWTESFLKKSANWLRSVWIYDSKDKAATITRGTKSDQRPLLRMGLLKKNAKLLAGKRKLYLGWYGGKPPFKVQLRYGKKISSYNTIKHNIHFLKRRFRAGQRYQILITDAKQNQVRGKFKVVAQSILSYPQAKKIKHSRLLKRQFKKTLLATWLASLNNGEWMLEAYQQVAGIHHYYPAELVKKGLILGSRPVFRPDRF